VKIVRICNGGPLNGQAVSVDVTADEYSVKGGKYILVFPEPPEEPGEPLFNWTPLMPSSVPKYRGSS
jgi:hypothetical protein